MTFVGKILVIVIMVFSLFFLALSTVVLTTEVNWKKQVQELTEAKKKLNDEKARLVAEVGTQKTNVDAAKTELDAAQKNFAAQLKSLTAENTQRQDEITKQRTVVESSLQEVKKAQDEAQARIDESTVLRDNLQKVQAQRDEIKLQNLELDQKIIVLQRDLDVAKSNNANLRERVAVYMDTLRRLGQSTDPDTLKSAGGPTVPSQDVEGEVTKVSSDGKSVELSIGKDDGLKEGNELTLFRTKPQPQYIGKIKIISVDPDKAVGKVIGGTFHGVKIQEGDNVATQIRTRG